LSPPSTGINNLKKVGSAVCRLHRHEDDGEAGNEDRHGGEGGNITKHDHLDISFSLSDPTMFCFCSRVNRVSSSRAPGSPDSEQKMNLGLEG
jgi:hypothetical protein